MKISYVGINKITYPLHTHKQWEVLYYTEGKGYLSTKTKDIPFEKGTIIIIPPNYLHGTVSLTPSTNISIGGDFDNVFMSDTPIRLSDVATKDGEMLINLIFNNRLHETDYLSLLVSSYVNFILQNIRPQTELSGAVNRIIAKITESFYDPALNLTEILNQSGYTEDYIRSQFKEKTGKSPVRFLTKIRIDHAKKLFDIYGNAITVANAAEACGFDDPIYFSKRFKELIGVSPDSYKKNIQNSL